MLGLAHNLPKVIGFAFATGSCSVFWPTQVYAVQENGKLQMYLFFYHIAN